MIESILSRFGYVKSVPHTFDRINNGDDAVSRGQRWQLFYSEIGGLHDMISDLRRSYFEKVSMIKPGDTDALQALSMAYKIAGEIDSQVRTVIETGKLREAEAEHVNRIAATTR